MPGTISTGFEEMDRVLQGGYETDILTTIFGPAGSGKTNLCLLLAAFVARSKKVVFVDTENNFSVERLKQIAPDYEALLPNILVLKPNTFDEQQKAFSELRKILDKNLGAIIVDTIVMLYRVERGQRDSYQLNKELGLQVSYLAEVARKRDIPVLLTSQVYSPLNQTNEVRMVGGDLLNYASKCILELQKFKSVHRLIVRKHRSIPERTLDFRIVENGLATLR